MKTFNAVFLGPLAILWACFLGCGSADVGDVEKIRGTTKEKDFADLFRKVETIALSEEALIGHIVYLDVSTAGDFLVTDIISQEVLLFDQAGTFKRRLTAEPCHPGFTMRPILATYTSDGSILLLNGGPWGYRFDSDGNCMEGVHESFQPPSKFCFEPTGLLYGYYIASDGTQTIKVMNKEGRVLRAFDLLPSDFPNLSYHMVQGGIVCGEDALLYQAEGTRPDIHVYDTNGILRKVISTRPDYYDEFDSDIPTFTMPQAMMQDIAKSRQSATMTLSIHNLPDEKFLLQYYHHNKHFGLGILNRV